MMRCILSLQKYARKEKKEGRGMAEKNSCKLIGENLKVLRKTLGITQMEAAERIDISVSGYREIERGNANPTLRTLELIAKGLDVPPLALLKNSMEEEKVQITRAIMLIAVAVSKLSLPMRKQFLDQVNLLVMSLSEPEEFEQELLENADEEKRGA
jgi:transcriptional regulator with XRE-family HTH domain